MLSMPYVEPVDYLVIGHLTRDLTPQGSSLGGTAAYAALTARAMGLRVGVLTSTAPDTHPAELEGIQIVSTPSDVDTTFENVYTNQGRIQHLYSVATTLSSYMIPESWRDAPIVHLGPVAQEIEPTLVRAFSQSLIGLTPQGWLRSWNGTGIVSVGEWPEATFVLQHASAAVLSIEDVGFDENRVDEMASAVPILVVTEGAAGSRLYWSGDVRRFRPPQVVEVDPVGAGDVFAAAFFARLNTTRDPWEAARFATQLAAVSVTRPGLRGVPTPEEVRASLIEVF